MKTLAMITVAAAAAAALVLLGPLEAQESREQDRRSDTGGETREEPRASGLARFAARMLGADEDEAAALLLPAVQALRAPGAAAPLRPCNAGDIAAYHEGYPLQCQPQPPAPAYRAAGDPRAAGVNIAAADLNGDGVVSEADCRLALQSPETVETAALTAYLKIGGIDGEARSGQSTACGLAAQAVIDSAPRRSRR